MYSDRSSSSGSFATTYTYGLNTAAWDREPAPAGPGTHYSPPQKARMPHDYLAVSAQQVYIGGQANVPMVASRVSIVDFCGHRILDTYVRPTQPVTDYRFHETGLMAAHLATAPSFADVQCRVAALMSNKIIVGYSLWHFLLVMGISHPAIDTRDVALFLPFRKTLRTRQTIPLPTLSRQLMGRNVGYGYEEPLEHARAALDLYRSTEDVWEGIINTGAWPCALPPSSYATCFS